MHVDDDNNISYKDSHCQFTCLADQMEKKNQSRRPLHLKYIRRFVCVFMCRFPLLPFPRLSPHFVVNAKGNNGNLRKWAFQFPVLSAFSLFFSVCFSLYHRIFPFLEIPLPSSPSKQLTHVIAEPKETSKFIHRIFHFYHFFFATHYFYTIHKLSGFVLFFIAVVYFVNLIDGMVGFSCI